MPTVEELEISYRDAVTAGAKAGTEALNRLADAAETTDARITRSGRTATGYVNALDDVTKSANRLKRAQAELVTVQKTVNEGVTEGTVTQEQAARAIDTQAAKVAALQARHEASVAATKASNAAVAETAEVARVSGYQLGILADEAHKFVDQIAAGGSAVKAAFYQLPNAIQVLGGFSNAAKVATGFLAGPGGLVAGVAAFGAVSYAFGHYAEEEAQQLATLSVHLRATRDDYTAMASSAEEAARKMAGTSGLSLGDSRSVTSTLAAVPVVGGSDLSGLASEARDLAAVLGSSVPEAAQKMTEAWQDPTKAAQNFAQEGLLGVNQALVMQVQDLQANGDRLGAWQLLMKKAGDAARGAADQGMTPLQQSLHALDQAFNGSLNGAKSFSKWIGDDINAGLASTVDELTAIVSLVNRVRGLGGSGATGSSGHSSTSSLPDQIASIGHTIGANSDVIALAQHIQPVESASGQYDAAGRLVTSSAGAVGAMQVMASNANGNDLTTTTGNITAAEQLLIHLYQKYDGNQTLVAMAYNWGEGNVDAYLQGAKSVPSSVADYAQRITGGQTYSATTTAAKIATIDDGLGSSDGSTAARIAGQTEAIQQLTAAQKALDDLHQAGSVSDSAYADQTQQLTQRLNEHRAALNAIKDPFQEMVDQQKQAVAGAWAETDAQRAMLAADRQVEEAARRMGAAHATATQRAEAEANAQQVLTGQFNSSVSAIERRTQAQQDLISDYDASRGTLTQYLNAEQAADTVRATSIDGTAEQARQVAELTSALNAQSSVQAQLTVVSRAYQQSQDLDYIKAETAAIGKDAEASSVRLAILKETQQLQRDGVDLSSKAAQRDLANVAAIQSATAAYEHQKQVLSDVTGSLSSIADTISDDVTQAFVQGSSAGVSFKSALQGIETQVIALVARLALINPLLNDIDGGSRSTISDLSSLLSGSSSLSGPAGSSVFGNGVIESDPFAGTGITAGASLTSGVFGSGAIEDDPFAAADSGGSLFGLSGLSGALKTPLFGSATIGSALGGIGAGFGVGSLLSGLIGRNSTGGTIGSGVGSLAGAAIGSIVPGVGTVLGGLAGGLFGSIGSLFGGHKKNPYTIDTVLSSGGSLSLGQTWNQSQTDGITAQLTSDISSINSLLSSYGLNISNVGGTVRDDPNNKDPALRTQTLEDQLGRAVVKSSSDPVVSQALSQGLTGSYSSVSDFTSQITQLRTMALTVEQLGVAVSKFNSDGTVTVEGVTTATGDLRTALDHVLDGQTLSTSDLQSQISTITTFVDSTMPGLLNATVDGQQSWADKMTTLQATYQAAATQADSYGLDGSAITDKYSTLYAASYQQQLDTLDQSDASVRARYLTATGDDEGAALLNFDTSAQQQRDALNTAWEDFLGDSYTSQSAYIKQSTDLEKTLAAERLSIQKQYSADSVAAENSAAQNVASVVSSLSSYAKSLGTSTASPLSAAAQYQQANDNFTSDYASARTGDYTALGALQDDIQSLLSTSQAYNGSGAAYAADYERALSALRDVGTISSDALTQSALDASLQDQTDTLAALLQQLVTNSNKSLAEQKQAALRKAS